ncbi:MAG: transglycosylase SLT domain-containing protein [Bacteroidia bacterium]|nr:transglycosylase SLT domain-containing protein [Bacteroidia bacterium]
MKMRKLMFTLFACLFLGQANAQGNSILRIDSLTHQFLEATIVGKPLAQLTTEEVLNLTEEKFNQMVALMGTTIQFKFDQSVKTQMMYMKDPASSFLFKACNRKNLYFPVFEEVLDKKHMPDEIKYLSIVESLLSTNAVSWCGATGLWQFMPATGRMMDLAIDSELDERKDIYKSTEKACDYLLSMYNLYGDWLLALAAYNGGPGNVNKAIRHSGGKKTFWEIRRYLPKETQNYVPKFLATAFLMTFSPPEHEDFNILRASETLVPVYLCCPVDMKYVCALVNVSESEKLEWNSVYKNGFIPANIENKRVVLPYKKAMQLAEWQDSIYAISDNSFNPNNYILNESVIKYHAVKKGQSLAQIASIYHVSVSSLKKWNGLKSTKVKAGRKLKIYSTNPIVLPVKCGALGFLYYITDNESQTINDICSRFKEFDMARICEMNGISSINTPIGKGKLIRLYTFPE